MKGGGEREKGKRLRYEFSLFCLLFFFLDPPPLPGERVNAPVGACLKQRSDSAEEEEEGARQKINVECCSRCWVQGVDKRVW